MQYGVRVSRAGGTTRRGTTGERAACARQEGSFAKGVTRRRDSSGRSFNKYLVGPPQEREPCGGGRGPRGRMRPPRGGWATTRSPVILTSGRVRSYEKAAVIGDVEKNFPFGPEVCSAGAGD